MSKVPLFLVAYDSPRRPVRTRIRSCLKETAIGHQRSVYEHFLSPSERQSVLRRLNQIIQPEDNLWAWAVDPRSAVKIWGIARKPVMEEAIILL